MINIEKNKNNEIILNIINNISMMAITYISASSIFDLQYNKVMFLLFVPLLGISNYFLKEMQIMSREAKICKNELIIIEQLLVLEKTVSELQMLCTDEDVLERCRLEVGSELKKIKEKIMQKKKYRGF